MNPYYSNLQFSVEAHCEDESNPYVNVFIYGLYDNVDPDTIIGFVDKSIREVCDELLYKIKYFDSFNINIINANSVTIQRYRRMNEEELSKVFVDLLKELRLKDIITSSQYKSQKGQLLKRSSVEETLRFLVNFAFKEMKRQKDPKDDLGNIIPIMNTLYKFDEIRKQRYVPYVYIERDINKIDKSAIIGVIRVNIK